MVQITDWDRQFMGHVGVRMPEEEAGKLPGVLSRIETCSETRGKPTTDGRICFACGQHLDENRVCGGCKKRHL